MPARTLPLRPLTVGELLDTAVDVTRGAARVLVPVALLLSVAEQAVMFFLRREFFDGAVLPDPTKLVGPAWGAVAIGAGLESLILALLGVVAGRAAAAAFVGQALPARSAFRLGDLAGAVLIGLIAGITTGTVTLLPLGWVIAYPLFGLAVPALVIDRRGVFGGLGRGVKMLFRTGGRPIGIRLLGYLGWLPLRLAFLFGGLAVADFVGLRGHTVPLLVAGAFTAVANSFAYATLAGLDAVLHLETRVRTEGLDIALSRTAAPLSPAHLAVTV
ncbi:hypothetical protein [Hamadaea tsunoensis]|uniref:hypothetical protein n=1 Tax=Hamadaea tsunoensis TaxID=53368 RepID=UPI001FE11CE7|nr:hypothetical protein [Hamadaea tsunoensis]